MAKTFRSLERRENSNEGNFPSSSESVKHTGSSYELKDEAPLKDEVKEKIEWTFELINSNRNRYAMSQDSSLFPFKIAFPEDILSNESDMASRR